MLYFKFFSVDAGTSVRRIPLAPNRARATARVRAPMTMHKFETG
jgi:hypothetical protein